MCDSLCVCFCKANDVTTMCVLLRHGKIGRLLISIGGDDDDKCALENPVSAVVNICECVLICSL